jgi:F0F1-type ATP synthase assembly protein I
MADQPRDWKKSWVQAEKMIELGITLPIATVLGWLIGDALDKKFHTSWMGIVGLIIGVAAGLTRLVQRAMAIGAEDSGSSGENSDLPRK